MTQPASVRAAMEGIAAVIHLAVASGRRRWDLTKAQRGLGDRPSVRLEELGYVLGDEREPYGG